MGFLYHIAPNGPPSPLNGHQMGLPAPCIGPNWQKSPPDRLQMGLRAPEWPPNGLRALWVGPILVSECPAGQIGPKWASKLSDRSKWASCPQIATNRFTSPLDKPQMSLLS